MASTACLHFVAIVDCTADNIRHLLWALGICEDRRRHWKVQVVDRTVRAEEEASMECDLVGVVAHRCEEAVVAGNAVSIAHDN